MRDRRFRLALAASALVALVARLYGLGAASLWLDEALEWQRAALPLDRLLAGRPLDLDPPLFSLLLRAWTLGGDAEGWLRLPSVLFGVAAVWLAGQWLAPRVGRRVALITALGMALAPVLVHYGQEVNQYSALVALSVALYWAADRVVAMPGGAVRWRVLGLVSVLGLFTFYGFAVPLAAVCLRLWRAASPRPFLRRYLVLLSAAVVVLAILGLGQKLQVPVIPRRWGWWVDLPNEWLFFKDLAWHQVVVFMLFPFSGGAGPFWANVLALGALAGAARLWRGQGRDLVVWTFLVPLAISYSLHCLGLYPLGNRYGLYLLPPMLLGLASAVDGIARRSRLAGAALLALVLALFVLFHPQRWWPNPWLNPPREDIRAVAAWVAEGLQEADRLETNAAGAPALSYYGRSFERPPDVAILDLSPAAEDASANAPPPGAAPRVWLVLSHVEPAEETAWLAAARARLGPGSRVEAVRRAENAVGYLLVRPDR